MNKSAASTDTSKAEQIGLAETAYRLLRERIVNCELAPGTRFTEKQLIAETGLGRTPVHEALSRLDHDGLVITLPRSGYQVAPLNEKSARDLHVVWRVVGPLIAREAVTNMTEAQRAEIEDFNRQVTASPPRTPREQIALASQRFRIMAAATGNPQLIYIFNRVYNEMERTFSMYFFKGNEENNEFWDEHFGDYKPLDSASVEELESMIREWTDRAFDVVYARLRAEAPDSGSETQPKQRRRKTA